MTNVHNPSRLILVGLCGRRGAGKDTCAQVLVEEYGFRRMAFADPLKQAARTVFRLTHAQVHGTLEQKEAPDPRWRTAEHPEGLSPRDILQRFGTEVARAICTDVWVRSLFYEIADIQQGVSLPLKVVITDVRFPNEAQEIRACGGTLVKLVRVGGPQASAEQMAHASEAQVDSIDADYLYNVADGDLDGLYLRAHDLASRLRIQHEDDAVKP